MASLTMKLPQMLFEGQTPQAGAGGGNPLSQVAGLQPQMASALNTVGMVDEAEQAGEKLLGQRLHELHQRLEALNKAGMAEAHALLQNRIKFIQSNYLHPEPVPTHVDLFGALRDDFALPPGAFIRDSNGYVMDIDVSLVPESGLANLQEKGFTAEEIETLKTVMAEAYRDMYAASTGYALVDVAMIAPEELKAEHNSAVAQDVTKFTGLGQGIAGATIGTAAGLVVGGMLASATGVGAVAGIPMIVAGLTTVAGTAIGWTAGTGGLGELMTQFGKNESSASATALTTSLVNSNGDFTQVSAQNKGNLLAGVGQSLQHVTSNPFFQLLANNSAITVAVNSSPMGSALTGGAKAINVISAMGGSELMNAGLRFDNEKRDYYQTSYANMIGRYEKDVGPGVFTLAIEELKKTPDGTALANKLLKAYRPEILMQQGLMAMDTPQAEQVNSQAALDIIAEKATILMSDHGLNADQLIRLAKAGINAARGELPFFSEQNLSWLLAHGAILFRQNANPGLSPEQLVAQFGKTGVELITELKGDSPQNALFSLSSKINEGGQGLMNLIGSWWDKLMNTITDAFSGGAAPRPEAPAASSSVRANAASSAEQTVINARSDRQREIDLESEQAFASTNQQVLANARQLGGTIVNASSVQHSGGQVIPDTEKVRQHGIA